MSRGYSLLEVSLAMGIGLLLLGGTLIVYQTMKEQSGDAGMRQKVHDLQALVEEMSASTGALPDEASLRSAWARRRADYNQSPWGGPVVDSSADRKGLVYGQNGSPVGNGIVVARNAGGVYSSLLDATFEGGVYFYPINKAPDGKPGEAYFWDLSREQLATASFYAVAGNKPTRQGGQRHFYVLSGR